MKAAELIDAAKLAALLVGGYLAWRAFKKVQAEGVAGAVSGAAVGGVKAIGSALGIPDTDATACAKAKASGDAWAASFACPAGDFLSWGASSLWDGVSGGSKSSSAQPSRKATQADTIQWQQDQSELFGGWSFDQLRTGGYSPFGLY